VARCAGARSHLCRNRVGGGWMSSAHLHPSFEGRCCQTSRADASLVCVRRLGHSGSHHNYNTLWNDGEPIDIVPWDDEGMAVWADLNPEMAARWDAVEQFLESESRRQPAEAAAAFHQPPNRLIWATFGIVALAIVMVFAVLLVLVIHSLIVY